MNNNERGVAINEVMRELALRNHLRKLAAQRDRQYALKKSREKKEACTAATEQTSSIKNMQLKIHTKDTTKDAVCQGGGVLT